MKQKNKFLYYGLFLWMMIFASMNSYGQLAFEATIANGNDDAEESDAGAMYLNSSDLELVNDGNDQTVGLRFTNVYIPQGAEIISAYIQFTTDEATSEATNLTLKGELTDNAQEFTLAANNISSRTTTVNDVAWNDIPAWNTVGQAGVDQQTPDLSAIIEEIVSQGGWAKGNALSIIITGTGHRVAYAYEGDITLAPKLVVQYYLKKTIISQIIDGNDDVEENGPSSPFGYGNMYMNSSDLEIVTDGASVQTIGLRFLNIDVPKNAIIQNAHISFTAKDNTSDSTTLYIKIQDTVNAEPFNGSQQFNASGRTVIMDSVSWIDVEDWTNNGVFSTPSLAVLVDSITSKSNWVRGNNVVFIINGYGNRRADSYEGDVDGAATLSIEYLSDQVAPELVNEIPDKQTKAGWSFSIDVKPFFRDEDSEIGFTANLADGRALPAWMNISNGVISGYYEKPLVLPIQVNAGSLGDTVSDQFMLIIEPQQQKVLTQLGTIQFGSFEGGAAEISAYDPISHRLFVTNAEANVIEIIDMSNPSNLVDVGSIDFTPYGAGVNSVAVHSGLLVAAIESDPKQNPGKVVAYDMDGNYKWDVTVGALPDMVCFTNDGTKVLVANEGEPSDDYLVDPEGTISIIDTTTKVVTTADFTAFNADLATLLAQGIRIFGTGATVAQDMEPEYIAINETNDTAFVTLQENNAIAVVDIANANVVSLLPLGYKDHSLDGQGLDASNKADFIEIKPWPVKGLYLPDAISAYKKNNTTFLLTANEGDAREYDDFEEESDIEDLDLDAATFGDLDYLQNQDNLGKLKVSTALADTNASGEYQSLYSFGTRSFSIWNSATGDLVFDSGDDFEQITASLLFNNFNCSNTNNELKDRSDNKGPEPEALTIGTIDTTTYAFIGLERVGGIMVYDITNPNSPKFVEYSNNRDFSTDPEVNFDIHGDNGPEGIIFIPASESPNGQNLIVVSNEISGTVTTYSVGEAEQMFTLGIFHNNDGESDMLGDTVEINGEQVFAGSIAQFITTLDSLRQLGVERNYPTIMLSSGDNFLAGKEFNASMALNTYFDAIALDAIDYDAICLGNHDFDFGPNVLAELINAFQNNLAPYLSSNLNFSLEPNLQQLVDNGRIAPSTIVERNGELIGVIGLTTPMITNISSPGMIQVSEFLVDSVQAQVDYLINQNVNKIILISHLQSINEDTALIKQLSGIDLIIAGGGDEFLSNSSQTDPYGLTPYGPYPIVALDADSVSVPVVTTPGNYRYIGQLLVDFDHQGNLTRIYDESGPVFVMGALDTTMVNEIMEPINNYISAMTSNIIAQTEVEIDYLRSNIRTEETNGGNLVADALLWHAMNTHAAYGLPAPQVALQNGGGLRLENTVPVGDFAEVLTYDICAFNNQVCMVEAITPQKFKELMENGVSNVENVDGRFPQIAGFTLVYNPLGDAGSRVISITLNDNTPIVSDGQVVQGAPNVNMATIDFLAKGGDFYPFDLLNYTILGATYQQALFNYIVDENGLDSLISASQYPAGGEGRIIEQIIVPSLSLPFYEDFNTGNDGWVLHNTTGAQEWTNEPQFGVGNSPMMKMSGYASGAHENEDWLISPALDINGISAVDVAFQSNVRYDGPDMEVKYSTDYSGIGDPSLATWTTVPDVTIAQNHSQWIWEQSGVGTITNLNASNLFIAFTYYSTDTEAATWEVDSLYVKATSNNAPIVVNAIEDTVVNDVLQINLAEVFTDPDNDILSYSASIQDSSIVSIEITDSILTITALSLGNTSITVVAQDELGAYVSDEFMVTVPDAIQEKQLQDVQIFPNPSDGYFVIHFNDIKANKISVINIAGSELLNLKATENNVNVDLRNYPDGMYFVKIQFTDRTKVYRLIKQ